MWHGGTFLARMRGAGIERIVLASGDKREVANAIVRALGVDENLYELSPGAKVESIFRSVATARS